MTAALKTFTFSPSMALRSLQIEGQPWFIAKDVAHALGFRDASSATQHLDADERQTLLVEGLANRGALVVNESGLYSLVLRSRKPEAKAFRKWVTGTVLPALHRDGLYIDGQEKPVPEDISLADLQAQQAALAAKVSAKLAEIAEAQTLSWARSREEKQARRDGFRCLRGLKPRGPQ